MADAAVGMAQVGLVARPATADCYNGINPNGRIWQPDLSLLSPSPSLLLPLLPLSLSHTQTQTLPACSRQENQRPQTPPLADNGLTTDAQQVAPRQDQQFPSPSGASAQYSALQMLSSLASPHLREFEREQAARKTTHMLRVKSLAQPKLSGNDEEEDEEEGEEEDEGEDEEGEDQASDEDNADGPPCKKALMVRV